MTVRQVDQPFEGDAAHRADDHLVGMVIVFHEPEDIFTTEAGNTFRHAVEKLAETAHTALDKAGLSGADVNWIVPHQANIRIIQSASKRLKVPMDKVIANVDKYGNTSSASIPLALEEALQTGKIKNNDIVVLVGFGAGLTWASCVMKWCKEENTFA